MNQNTGGPASEKTLLDEFAGQAFVLMSGFGTGSAKMKAIQAYAIAEAMLTEKALRETPPTERISIGSDEKRKAFEAFKLLGSINHPEFDAVRLAIAKLTSRFEVGKEAVVKESSTTQDAGKVVWKQSPNMNGAIICETQFSAMHADEENVTSYGGYLVAESVPEEAKALIIRAPQLEAANRELVNALEKFIEAGFGFSTSPAMRAEAYNKACEILAKAKEVA